jgi:benzoyl-CoA reductase subunit C
VSQGWEKGMNGLETKNEKGREAGNILNGLNNLVKDPYGGLNEWKAVHKKKIIACMPMQIPEEIIHAAGALPVVIPESREPITIASKHIQNFFCGYARSVIDVVLKGKLDFLDGMVFQDTCHTMRPIFDIINANHPFPYMQRIFMPLALQKSQAKPFLLGELKRFKTNVEKFIECEISDEALQNSIDTYNENRGLMAGLYDIRRDRPEIMTAREIVTINMAGMLMPKEEHSALLKTLVPALRERKPPIDNADDRTRLVMTGSLCEAPPDELLDLTEQLGGIVVDDDLYTGSRYFLTKVSLCEDPVEGLADAYLQMVSPCPTRIYPKLELGPYLVNIVKKANAKGLIIVMVKFCEAHDYTYPHMRRHLDAAGIPYLMIKTEHGTTSVEQLKTRLQAFLEIVGRR